MRKVVLLVTVLLIITLLVAGILITFYLLKHHEKPLTEQRGKGIHIVHVPFVCYWPFNILDNIKNDGSLDSSRENYAKILEDLALIKELGFKGIKLFGIEQIEQKGFTQALFIDADRLELSIILAFRPWSPEEFPHNKTRVREWRNFIANVVTKVRDHRSLLWYSLHYPVHNYTDLRKTFGIMRSYEYRRALQELINTIRQNDPFHPVYLAVDGDPRWPFPYHLGLVEGYGVMPYPWKTPQHFDEERVETFLSLFHDRGMKAYIDEWGVQTLGGYPWWKRQYGEVQHGKAEDEETKAHIITEFYHYIRTQPIIWCYFALHDTGESDWGLAYSNNTLKESGKTLKVLLTQE